MKSTVVLFAALLSLPTDMVRSQHASVPQIANDFVVLAYPAPPPEQANAERYREIANAGFDAIVPGWGLGIENHIAEC